MEPKQKNAPLIAKIEERRKKIDEIIATIKEGSNNKTDDTVVEKLTEARMWSGIRLVELGAFEDK